jgi:hypothetical protein
MRKTNLQIIDELPNGTPLEAFEGRVEKVWNRLQGENEHGDWSFQNLEITSGGTKVTVKLKDREPFPESWKGKEILVTHGVHGKTGKATGIEVIDENVKGKTMRRIKVTASAEIALLDASEAPPARQQRQEAPREQQHRQERPAQPQETRRPAAPQQSDHSGDPVREAKILIAQVRTLHLLCYDAAVATAHDIYDRHGYAVPPGTVGIVADKYLMEAIRRTNIQGLPMTAPEPKGKPLSDLLPFCEAAWDAVTTRRVQVEEKAKEALHKPQEQHQPADQDGGDMEHLENLDDIPF